MSEEHLSLLVHWEGASVLIFETCAQMPRAARQSFALRLEGGALEVHSHLSAARFLRGGARDEALARADGLLATLRFVARLAHRRQHISHGRLEELSRALDEAGRMLGGWRRAGGR